MSGSASNYSALNDVASDRMSLNTDQPSSIDSSDPVNAKVEPNAAGSTIAALPKASLSVTRLFAQAKPERCILICATVALFLGAIFNLFLPAFAGTIIDSISNPPDEPIPNPKQLTKLIIDLGLATTAKEVLDVAVVGLSITIGIGSFFSFLRGWLFTLAGERVVARLRKRLFNAIMNFEIAFFDVTRTGELTNRLASDTTILKDAVTINVSMGLRYVATIVGGIGYLFILSWKLTLVMLSVVPLVAILAVCYGGKIRSLSKDTQDALARATEVAEESCSHIRTVRSFSREDLQVELYDTRIMETYRLGALQALLYGIFIGLIGTIGSGSMVLVLWYGANLVLQGALTSGELTSFVLYTITVAGSLAGVAGLFASIMKAVGANDRVFQLIDKIPSLPTRGGQQIQELQGRVELKSVHFTYPSRPDTEVLSDINIDLRPGTVTALVGPSGGGKSTVVGLIERFYDVTKGNILIDGVDIKSLDPCWVHRNMGLVSQEPVLFATDIRSNITYGVTKPVTDEQIISAARMANAHEFIAEFPKSYDTEVGERGVRLSGGQKQRIAIARAILLDPKILIADEATSSLDAESEYRVQEALDRLMEGRTVLVIAHRLSTVKNASCVVVIQNGKVAEKGTHSELLEASGVYAKLVRRQLEDPTAGGFGNDDERTAEVEHALDHLRADAQAK